LRLLTVALAVLGAYRVRRSGLGVQDFKAMFRQMIQGALAKTVQSAIYMKKQTLALVAL
jgi:hypothetical protein